MIYDCRKEGAVPGAAKFPCPVKVVDPATGERLPNVFYLDTRTARVGRFVTDAAGQPMVNPGSRRVRAETNPRTGVVCRTVEFDRLELWEQRAWVAVSLSSGVEVARSSGAG